MSKSGTVKEAVKESLVGSTEPSQLSAQAKTRFASYAVKDPESGELFMGPDQFIDAIAPNDEDYVSGQQAPVQMF
jgi:solute carrier family 25 (mitochondrial aspartate/glutamate transporter), member 12/13